MTPDPIDVASPPVRPELGARLVFRWRKWDGTPHWEHDCVYLGSDAWGDWVGQPAGWGSARPGKTFTAENGNVTLIPPSGDFALTVNRNHPSKVRVYVDLAWDVKWNGVTPEGIDMDLDVVRCEDERGVYIDDRDEWDDHRVRLGYPPRIVAHLEELAIDLERRVIHRQPPFDEATAEGWLDRLDALHL